MTQSNLLQILHSLNDSKDDDYSIITAGAINLYFDSMRRLYGRTAFSGGDAKALLSIIDLLLQERKIEPFALARPRHDVGEAKESLGIRDKEYWAKLAKDDANNLEEEIAAEIAQAHQPETVERRR